MKKFCVPQRNFWMNAKMFKNSPRNLAIWERTQNWKWKYYEKGGKSKKIYIIFKKLFFVNTLHTT